LNLTSLKIMPAENALQGIEKGSFNIETGRIINA